MEAKEDTPTIVEYGDIDPTLKFKQAVAEQIAKHFDLQPEQIVPLLEDLRDKKKGDLALHMAKLNKLKKLQGNPQTLAEECAKSVNKLLPIVVC